LWICGFGGVRPGTKARFQGNGNLSKQRLNEMRMKVTSDGREAERLRTSLSEQLAGSQPSVGRKWLVRE
jgi:hypothetical protein